MPGNVLTVTRFEHRSHPVASRRKFARRMLVAIGLWAVLTFVGLAIGMAGYAYFEGMSVTDAYVNAAMILSGMVRSANSKPSREKSSPVPTRSYPVSSSSSPPASSWRRSFTACCIASTSRRRESE